MIGIGPVTDDMLLAEPVRNSDIERLRRDLMTRQTKTLASGIDMIMADLKESMEAPPSGIEGHEFAVVFLTEMHRDPDPGERGTDWLADDYDTGRKFESVDEVPPEPGDPNFDGLNLTWEVRAGLRKHRAAAPGAALVTNCVFWNNGGDLSGTITLANSDVEDGIGLAVVQFLAAVLIAAAMLANDTATRAMIERLARRLVGDRADELLGLTTATIRSVAVGVLGVAFIQAVAGGVGMALAGVPGAGLWALFILILAIAQLPPLLVLLPAIIYVFSAGDSTTVAVAFTIWSIAVSFSDTFLKPLLLGRGVEAPMLVILLGAIGGMLMSGILGLFVGAVVLALGYKLFEAWLTMHDDDAETQETAS